MRIRTDDELLTLIKYRLSEGLDKLWDSLTPEERVKVFPSLIEEFIRVNY